MRGELKFLEAKLLKGLSTEEKLELATRALCDAAKEMGLLELRFYELVERLEGVVKRVEVGSWSRAINAELKRRENNRASSR
jgi:hypothetical protein